MCRLASRSFFSRDAASLARDLLGTTLVRTLPSGERLAGMIVETEAYVGVRDRASHAFGGRRTARNESMYAKPGTLYIYFTYGMHHCANIVCGKVGEPVAVLLRALRPTEGHGSMATNRGWGVGAAERQHELCRGPGNLCRALAIDRSLDGADLVPGRGGAIGSVSVEIPRRSPIEPGMVLNGPRIGLGNAGPWKDRPLRFWVRDSESVSGRRTAETRRPGAV